MSAFKTHLLSEVFIHVGFKFTNSVIIDCFGYKDSVMTEWLSCLILRHCVAENFPMGVCMCFK